MGVVRVGRRMLAVPMASGRAGGGAATAHAPPGSVGRVAFQRVPLKGGAPALWLG